MKRLVLITTVILTLFIILIVLNDKYNKDVEYEKNISVEELEKGLLEKEDYFVYFYQTDCIYCKETSPIIIPMAKEMKLDLKEVNLQDEISGWKKFNVEGTPTIIRFKDGVEVDRIHGLQSEDIFKKWFEDNK